MIISHKNKFIFIKTRKTAGTSIEIALSQICGHADVLTPINLVDEDNRRELGGKPPQNYEIPFKYYGYDDWLRLGARRKRKQFRNHNTAAEVKDNIDPEIWDSYYKFCFDRNPYDKVVSHFFWLGGFEKFGSLDNYVRLGNLGLIKGYDAYSINGVVAVDDVFRFEDLPRSLAAISARLGLQEHLALPTKRAKSNTRVGAVHYDEVLEAEQKQLISTVFAREISYMGYERADVEHE